MTSIGFLQPVAVAWPYIVAVVSVLLSLVAAGHALLHKRDSRAAMLWMGFIWLLPIFGSVLYFMLGVNRIKRQAIFLRGDLERFMSPPQVQPCSPDEIAALSSESQHLGALAELVRKVVFRP